MALAKGLHPRVTRPNTSQSAEEKAFSNAAKGIRECPAPQNRDLPLPRKPRRSSRVKIFQVLSGVATWGGGGTVVLALTRELVRLGCEVTVLCLSDFASEQFARAGARVVTSRYWRREINPPFDLLAFYELFRLCRRERFDIVHTHTSKGGFLGRIAARLAGVPTVIHTVHGFAFHEFTPGPVAAFYTLLERLASHFCDLVICVNDEDRRTAIRRRIVGPDKIVTIHNGIDVGRFVGARGDSVRRELALGDDALLIGTVGRLAPQKGFAHLLRAIPLVLRQHPEARFAFVGDGPLEAELKELAAELSVSENCHFLGFRRDIPEVLAACDVFVLPSLWEGLSITLLEAMAAGKPIVATGIKGNREVITDGVNGLLVRPKDSADLARAIIELIEDRERARLLGEKAHQTVRRRFDERAMLEKTLQAYAAAMAGSASPELKLKAKEVKACPWGQAIRPRGAKGVSTLH